MTKRFVTMDGNTAAAQAAYPFTEIAAIYPITPSSPMAELTDRWSARGRKNLFGQRVSLVEMQSEAGAIAAVHGALQTGALATTFTSSQGLLLMIPVLHRIAGERLPAVLHVAARTVGTHAMSIFGDHSDVMNCRQTGFAMLSTGSVQEVADLAAVAHLAAVRGRIPFLHFFDGFRTSHEIDKVEPPDEAGLTALLDREALADFRARALSPEHPMLRATVQNGDVYFQVREANNPFYDALPAVVEDYMAQIGALTGREYHLFNYFGAPDAEQVVVAMGSVSGAAREVVRALNARGGRTGYLQVHLYRPFAAERFRAALPATVRRIAVLDRCKEMGAAGEPLYLDVCAAFSGCPGAPRIVGGRYGLSSKDTTPGQIAAVFANLAAETPRTGFTIGITDDVTHRSLAPLPFADADPDTVRCKFWGLGGDGTVGANHNTVRIINDTTDRYAQAYFEYDAKKSFGVTKSHLRFSSHPIEGAYYVTEADFAACHNESFINRYDIAGEVRPGGTLLLNCSWRPDELETRLRPAVRREIARRRLRFFIIDATDIAGRLGLGSHTNTVLQSAFFALMEIIPRAQALEEMKKAVRKSYFTKGDEVVGRNLAAIDAGAAGVREIAVPAAWADAEEPPAAPADVPPVVSRLLFPINAQQGDRLPVSAFRGYEDGRIDMGLTAYERRCIAVRVPVWDADKCLQCNRCALVCPHAVIRPYLLTEAEAQAAPEGFVTAPARGAGAGAYRFALRVSDEDCTGCGSCVSFCPAREKALRMEPADPTPQKRACWDYARTLSDKGDVFDPYTVKGSQFRTPLLEFSAACAGCGETPYAKLLTQLFGDRVYWANGTGCSQAWGAPMPGIPYTVDRRGFGPAWSNCLFENNAEFSLGMFLSVRQQRAAEKARIERWFAATGNAAAREWLDGFDDFDRSRALSDALIAALRADGSDEARGALQYADQLTKKCFWMFGGDGWAYDIGFGGLDHVLASGEDINVFVIDTEVYSNTGGQSSKATPRGAVAQFASAGKRSRKKDLGAIFMTYGNVYVAQVAMGADPAQLLRAVREAEAYRGPSLIIAYTPCTAHGIRAGMSEVQHEMKRAVDAGYWLLYRYHPAAKEAPFCLDSPPPALPYEEFLDGETRYAALRRTFPENAEKLFAAAGRDAARQYARWRELARRQAEDGGKNG